MYIRKRLIAFLKIKNAVLLFFGLFFAFIGAADIISMVLYYRGDMETVINAVSFPGSIVCLFVGAATVLYVILSSIAIKKAMFYGSCFENSLYDSISFSELSGIMGYSSLRVRRELHLLRRIYMCRFVFSFNDDGEYIELYSKKISCSCRSCGAVIEKKEYFAGICPYCKNSDIFASVITDNRAYSISSDTSAERSKRNYYLKKSLPFSMTVFLILSVIFMSAAFIMIFIIIDFSVKYFNTEYLTELIMSGEGYSTIELNQSKILNNIVWFIFFELILLPIAIIALRKCILISRSINIAESFSRSQKPFVYFSSLRLKKAPSLVRRSIQSGYLKNCAIEKHIKSMRISLAKKIVRDRCPYCAAPIAGAVNEDYICPYCKNRLINVIAKKQV